jgi:methanogenic corrinoid protein MtbC1
MAEELVKAMAYLTEEEALRIAKKRLDKGDDPMKILEDSQTNFCA